MNNTTEELAEQEALGRRIAAALEPLGLSPAAIQRAAAYAASEGFRGETAAQSRRGAQKEMMREAHLGIATRYARAAGAAAYFEEKAR